MAGHRIGRLLPVAALCAIACVNATVAAADNEVVCIYNNTKESSHHGIHVEDLNFRYRWCGNPSGCGAWQQFSLGVGKARTYWITRASCGSRCRFDVSFDALRGVNRSYTVSTMRSEYGDVCEPENSHYFGIKPDRTIELWKGKPW